MKKTTLLFAPFLMMACGASETRDDLPVLPVAACFTGSQQVACNLEGIAVAHPTAEVSGDRVMRDGITRAPVAGLSVTVWSASGARKSFTSNNAGVLSLGADRAATLRYKGHPDYVETISVAAARLPSEHTVVSHAAVAAAQLDPRVSVGSDQGIVVGATCDAGSALANVANLIVELQQNGSASSGATVFYSDEKTLLPDSRLSATTSVGAFTGVAKPGTYSAVVFGTLAAGDAPVEIGRVDNIPVVAGTATNIVVHPGTTRAYGTIN